MSLRTASNSSLAKPPSAPLVYSSLSSERSQDGTALATMAVTSSGSNGSYVSEVESANLTMRHQPSEVKKPSGYSNGGTKKYQLDREYRTFGYDSIRLTLGLGSDSHSTEISHLSEQQITILKETVTVTRQRFIADFDEVDEHGIHSMTIEEYFDYIERQRLTHMPHRGSHWDKVLKWAEFFGLQVSSYADIVKPFLAESTVAARLIWTACRALLDV